MESQGEVEALSWWKLGLPYVSAKERHKEDLLMEFLGQTTALRIQIRLFCETTTHLALSKRTVEV